jgi:hypothetical protein
VANGGPTIIGRTRLSPSRSRLIYLAVAVALTDDVGSDEAASLALRALANGLADGWFDYPNYPEYLGDPDTHPGAELCWLDVLWRRARHELGAEVAAWRNAGTSWYDIGQATGTTKQGAQRKFGR